VGILKTIAKIAGILATIFGITFLVVGLYGLSGGTGATFEINGSLVTPQEGGQIFTIIGTIVLLIGIILTFFAFKMERKGFIAFIILVIVIVGGLGGYFFVMPREAPASGPMIYVDAMNYTSALTPWQITANNTSATVYTLHNITNLGQGNVDLKFKYTVSRYNGTQWVTLFNGTHWFNGTRWLTSNTNSNVTVSLVRAYNGLQAPWNIQAFQKAIEKAPYSANINWTDQAIYITLNYLGTITPTVDGQTVFNYLAFDGNANGILDASDKAFNFTNNPGLTPDKNTLRIYTPLNASFWNPTPVDTHNWNDDVSPASVPVSVAISSDRRNVTWTIPFNVIGAQKDKNIGLLIQAFGYDWFPSGVNDTTPPTPSNYQRVTLSYPAPASPFTFTVQPQTTMKFFIKIIFTDKANGDYSFTFQPYIP
jgi:hypothetical protein